jgi:hypothetical protein
VTFNLILEASQAAANQVIVSVSAMTGPNGASITSTPAAGDGVFNYVGRNIELFYIRYLEIKGLSSDLAYAHYDERHIPDRCRRPFSGEGFGSCTWNDRPCHNELYPDIAVPLELNSPFTIAESTNQSIWADIYIPKSILAGTYTGTVTVAEAGIPVW